MWCDPGVKERSVLLSGGCGVTLGLKRDQSVVIRWVWCDPGFEEIPECCYQVGVVWPWGWREIRVLLSGGCGVTLGLKRSVLLSGGCGVTLGLKRDQCCYQVGVVWPWGWREISVVIRWVWCDPGFEEIPECCYQVGVVWPWGWREIRVLLSGGCGVTLGLKRSVLLSGGCGVTLGLKRDQCCYQVGVVWHWGWREIRVLLSGGCGVTLVLKRDQSVVIRWVWCDPGVEEIPECCYRVGVVWPWGWREIRVLLSGGCGVTLGLKRYQSVVIRWVWCDPGVKEIPESCYQVGVVWP